MNSGPLFSNPIASKAVGKEDYPATPVNPFQVPDVLPTGKGVWVADSDELPPFMD